MLTPEEEKQEQEARNFDLLKYDGVKALKMGRADYAVRCFQHALELQQDLEVHDYMSQALITLGDLDGAFRELQTMAAAQPENVGVIMRMARVAYMMEDYQRMADLCRQAKQMDESSGHPCLLLAQALLGMGDLDGAVSELNTAVEKQDDYAEAYLLRAKTLMRQGRVDEADSDASWLMENVGDHEEVLLMKACVETAKGNTAEAMELYDKVIELNPFSVEAFKERAQLRQTAGDAAGAEDDFRMVRELNPTQDVEDIEQQVKQAYSAANPLGI